MAYTTIDKSKNHFNTVVYTGNASGSHGITGVNFRPDFLWIKPRSATDSHRFHSPLLTGSDYFLSSNTLFFIFADINITIIKKIIGR